MYNVSVLKAKMEIPSEAVSSVIKTLIFTILVPGTITVVIPYRLLGPGAKIASGFGLLGVLPIALGVMAYLWCAWDFATAGHGTPAPIDPPKILVARGLYQVVRNPIYVGVLLILLGESLLFMSLPILYYALGMWPFFHLFVIFLSRRLAISSGGRHFQTTMVAFLAAGPYGIARGGHTAAGRRLSVY